MATKPGGKDWTVKEQIIEDLVTGLSFKFRVTPDGEPRLHIYGDSLEFCNRDICFDKNGEESGGGTAMGGHCQATWINELSPPQPEDEK